MKMITINNRNELNSFLYEGDAVDTLVGVANIGGELLAEALTMPSINGDCFFITCFFPYGDEGEEIVIDANGNVLSDSITYSPLALDTNKLSIRDFNKLRRRQLD
jgi:hypothetical protein